MALDERPYYRDPGYSTNRFTAIFSGSVPLYTAFGIRVRAHNALLLFIAAEILLDWTPGFDLSSKFVSMAILCGTVLLHEYGHCIAARLVGGSASEILLWPLGGLAFPDVPERPLPTFLMVAAGPFVNALICLVTAIAVYFLTAAHFTLNPFASFIVPIGITWHSPAFYLWWIFHISYIQLLFNLLPIFPLDGGQMLQTVLWKFIGHHRSMMLSCVIGMGGSVLLAIVGIADHFNFLLVATAAWLFFGCQQRRIFLRETGPSEPWQGGDIDFGSSLRDDPTPRQRRVSIKARKVARKRARQEALERQRIDLILAKVSASGMNSLTWRERRALRQATEKLRQSEEEMKQILGD